MFVMLFMHFYLVTGNVRAFLLQQTELQPGQDGLGLPNDTFRNHTHDFPNRAKLIIVFKNS